MRTSSTRHKIAAMAGTFALVAGGSLAFGSVAGASTPTQKGHKPAEAGPPAHADQPTDTGRPEGAGPEHEQDGNGKPEQTPPEDRGSAKGTPPQASDGHNDESPGASGEHKQTICHRTRSASNPYVRITVDYHAVDGQIEQVSKGRGDHAAQHDTPAVFDPDTMHSGDKWGDIIPPFTIDGAEFAGLNWGAGESIFNRGCTVGSSEEGGNENTGGEDTGTDNTGSDNNGNGGNNTGTNDDNTGNREQRRLVAAVDRS